MIRAGLPSSTAVVHRIMCARRSINSTALSEPPLACARLHRPLVSHACPLREYAQAMSLLMGRGVVGKVVIKLPSASL